MPEEVDRIGLADFLTDLRGELSEAHTRARGQALKLGVDEITVTLDLACTLSKAGEGSASVKAKFWVLEFGSAGVKGSVSSKHEQTQRVTVKLKPYIEEVTLDAHGKLVPTHRDLSVHGNIAHGEESPTIPQRPRNDAK